MPNSPQNKTGRPAKSDSRKKQKFGSTIPPELKVAATKYMSENEMDGSEFLEKAITMLLAKDAAEAAMAMETAPIRPLRVDRRSVKAKSENGDRV